MAAPVFSYLGTVVVDDRPCRAWHASRLRLRWLAVRVHVVVVAAPEPVNPAAAPLFGGACLAYARGRRSGLLSRLQSALAVVAVFPVEALDDRLREVLARPTQEGRGTWLIPVAVTPDGQHHAPPRLAQNAWLVDPYVRACVDTWASEHLAADEAPG